MNNQFKKEREKIGETLSFTFEDTKEYGIEVILKIALIILEIHTKIFIGEFN